MSSENWLTGGVDYNIPGDGGPICAGYTSGLRRLVDGIFFALILSAMIIYVSRYCHLPSPSSYNPENLRLWKDNRSRKILLAIVGLVFGMVLGFKFSSKTAIYLLNPCHIITVVQIYLLAATPSKTAAVIFRFHLGLINGGVLALAFPVINTLFLPFETEIFFIQHALILVVPLCLLNIGGPYSLENWSHVSWPFMSYLFLVLHHMVILPPIAAITQVNVSQVLCPAISDPFHGPNYRLWAIVHQGIFVPLFLRFYLAVAPYLVLIPGPGSGFSELESKPPEIKMKWDSIERNGRKNCEKCCHNFNNNNSSKCS